MPGYLWNQDLREHRFFRFFVALGAAIVLLFVGFIVGSLWAIGGVELTEHVLVPMANHVFSVPYAGVWIETLLIIAVFITRFGVLILLVMLLYPFFRDAKRGWYIASALAFAFYGWFFATMYIVYH